MRHKLYGSPNLNWANDLDSVLLAMEKVEGSTWLLQQLNYFEHEMPSQYSVAGVVEYLNRVLDDSDMGRALKYAYATVHGDGGFSRYFFRANGDVDFSRSHAMTEEHHRRAWESGFFTC